MIVQQKQIWYSSVITNCLPGNMRFVCRVTVLQKQNTFRQLSIQSISIVILVLVVHIFIHLERSLGRGDPQSQTVHVGMSKGFVGHFEVYGTNKSTGYLCTCLVA